MREKQRVKFTFIQELIKEPIIWKLAKKKKPSGGEGGGTGAGS